VVTVCIGCFEQLCILPEVWYSQHKSTITLVSISFLPTIILIDFQLGIGSQNRTCE